MIVNNAQKSKVLYYIFYKNKKYIIKLLTNSDMKNKIQCIGKTQQNKNVFF
ncbi:hypothetical protein EDD59_10363 [Muricomes intestini]|jgi:hypothetical protein|uniref:Uncharacterized protein n=1 Tax=Muricomes intestini TaxID=1796634 RepID=A0A4R3KEH8_9FIRM|nr:hypothetical protein EDD59_10363 [Muricomes intestini]